jgi:hypothetical protein
VNAPGSVNWYEKAVSNRTDTSTTREVSGAGDETASDTPSLLSALIGMSPNHTYTGTFVGNVPVTTTRVPPETGPREGDTLSTTQLAD